MKKVIIILVLLMSLGLVIYMFWPKEKEEIKTKEITTNVYEDQVLGNILIKNISISSKDDISTFSAKIKNLSGDVQSYKNLEITIITDNDEITLIGYFGETLDPEEEKIVTAQTNASLKNIKQIQFELK